VRVHWDELPADVRSGLEERMAGRVVEAVTQPHGFSPGLAARIRLHDGRRVFVKAVSAEANPDSPDIHRREARVLAAMPVSAPVPRLLWTYDRAPWVALGLEDIDGRHPHEPWTEHDLFLVVATYENLARELTPTPISVDDAKHGFERDINGWQVALARDEQRLDPWCRKHLVRLAELESRAPEAARGDTLLHFDARADNLLIAGERVYVLDWPWARTGAWWIDLVSMAPSVAMQGGPSPEALLARLDLRGVSKEDIDAVVCTIAGYFAVHALDPPPPGIPTVRAFQAAQGRVAIEWLRERLGWS
jgi:aminoglycoside phosphotransferase (APT) family kinase protein